MKILNRLPFPVAERTIYLPNQSRHTALLFQTIVQVSLSVRGQIKGPIPAFLDPGHNHNFSISATHVREWLGVNPADLKASGRVAFGGSILVMREADVFLHRNLPGSDELIIDDPFPLRMIEDKGIIVHESPIADLPILGIRSFVRNGLRLVFDFDKKFVTLQKGRW